MLEHREDPLQKISRFVQELVGQSSPSNTQVPEHIGLYRKPGWWERERGPSPELLPGSGILFHRHWEGIPIPSAEKSCNSMSQVQSPTYPAKGSRVEGDIRFPSLKRWNVNNLLLQISLPILKFQISVCFFSSTVES